MSELAQLIGGARRIVFFTGAGASTEPPTSLPDFRSSTGLWQSRTLMAALTRSNFFRDPEGFWRMFRSLFLPWLDAQPNAVHLAPARLAGRGKQVGVVTQNIDCLDARCATGYPVFELHGHLRSSTCPNCGDRIGVERYADLEVPRCVCGAVLKPDVVLFDDPLDFDGALLPARDLVEQADLLIVVGTSLTVAPASSLVLERSSRAPLVILNREPTPADREAALVLRGPAGEVLDAAIGPA